MHTFKRIFNWPPSYFHILGKVLGEKYKYNLIQFIANT